MACNRGVFKNKNETIHRPAVGCIVWLGGMVIRYSLMVLQTATGKMQDDKQQEKDDGVNPNDAPPS